MFGSFYTKSLSPNPVIYACKFSSELSMSTLCSIWRIQTNIITKTATHSAYTILKGSFFDDKLHSETHIYVSRISSITKSLIVVIRRSEIAPYCWCIIKHKKKQSTYHQLYYFCNTYYIYSFSCYCFFLKPWYHVSILQYQSQNISIIMFQMIMHAHKTGAPDLSFVWSLCMFETFN